MARGGWLANPRLLWAAAGVVVAVGIGAAWILGRGRNGGAGGAQGELEVYDVHLVTELGPEGRPGQEVEVLSPQAQELHLLYRYRGARAGERLACEWYCNDEPITDLRREVELPAAQGWGRFDLVIRAALPTGSWGVKLRAGQAEVGMVGFRVAALAPPPLISNVVTCEGVDEQEQPVNARREFPPRVAAIFVRFDYANAPLGDHLTCQWRLEDEIISEATTTQEIGAPGGSGHFYLANPRREELPAGEYSVQILHRERVVGQADFRVSPEAEGGERHD